MTSRISADWENWATGHWLGDFANFSALVFASLPDVNWAGFYLDYGDRLRLGPFCGKPACTEIGYGKGVCGAAFLRRQALLVPDVHDFPGHIACDSASRSELVIPLWAGSVCVGVFDIDSPRVARFTEVEREEVSIALEKLQKGIGPAILLEHPWRT